MKSKGGNVWVLVKSDAECIRLDLKVTSVAKHHSRAEYQREKRSDEAGAYTSTAAGTVFAAESQN